MNRLLLAVSFLLAGCTVSQAQTAATVSEPPSGVCPPFPLRDEAGQVIDPVHGLNATSPYSPRQTCGAEGCHDYAKVTEGFHFTQGRGEELPESWKARYTWALYPGNYGGNWCSPAPLYRALAAKHNEHARDIDLTSFDFVTATCGACHPGGGPLEMDREGHRYDAWMADPATDCHAAGAGFFDRPVLASAFGADGEPVWRPNAEILGVSPGLVRLGAFREGTLKPVLYGLLALVGALLGELGARTWTVRAMGWTAARGRLVGLGLVGAVVVGGLVVLAEPGLLAYMTLSRFALDAAHFPVAVVVLVIGALFSTLPVMGVAGRRLRGAGLVAVVLAALCGGLMLLKLEAIETLVHLSDTGFDLALALSLVVSALQILTRLSRR